MRLQTLTWTAVLTLLLAPVVAGQDWPQWRGARRDGEVTSFREPASWPKTLTERWKVEVGTGYATPILVGERIYMFSRQGEEEVLRSEERRVGKEGRSRWSP